VLLALSENSFYWLEIEIKDVCIHLFSDSDGLNLLHHAILRSNYETVKSLIEFAKQKLDEDTFYHWINQKSIDKGWTPFHFVAL
jgi:ankyrin repeat protein